MIFVDANVLLEVILKRNNQKACERLLSDNNDKAISILTVDLVMYFVEKDKLSWQPIKTFLDSFHWLPILDTDVTWAFSNFNGDDFEDALQISCAIRENCKVFATLDELLAAKYGQILPVKLLR